METGSLRGGFLLFVENFNCCAGAAGRQCKVVAEYVVQTSCNNVCSCVLTTHADCLRAGPALKFGSALHLHCAHTAQQLHNWPTASLQQSPTGTLLSARRSSFPSQQASQQAHLMAPVKIGPKLAAEMRMKMEIKIHKHDPNTIGPNTC